ncbi:GNAT family N-acetyltransferase [Streptomyces anulatus]|uniref:GNAT family N-acetyltransferase n=1 Tax=Streptomyces anulatus TaxID=1892 RepID=UPI003645C37C
MNNPGITTTATGSGVRVLADGDWGAVTALEAAVYGPLGLSEGELRLRSRARPSPGTCLVVESGGALAGYLLALPCPAFGAPDLARPEPPGADGAAAPSRNLHLHDLVIVPELRRRGLGRNVLDRLIRTARTRGYERLSLVAVGGSDAFWSSCGFVAHPSVPVPDSYGRSAVYMSLPLTAGLRARERTGCSTRKGIDRPDRPVL